MSTGRPTHDSERDPAAPGHRVLVVANETVEGRELLDEIRRRTQDRQPDRAQDRKQDTTKDTQVQVHVVAPALIRSRIRHGLGDVDEAKGEAEQRLKRSISAIEALGVRASGEVGDSDPNLAIKDALARFPADEVIISTHPRERSTWLEKKVVERGRDEIEQPITHVVVDTEARTEPEKAREVERLPRRRRRRGAEGADDGEEVDYLPPMSRRDRLTLAVGIGGTIVLGILALMCPDGGTVTGDCAARFLIALGAFMVTVWHVVALILMGSVRYRGFWEDAAANMVLFGIPPAILVSALLG